VDDEGDEATITITPDLSWVSFDAVSQMIEVDASLLGKNDAGIHEFTIVLTDEFNASRAFKQSVMLLFEEEKKPQESKPSSEQDSKSTQSSKPTDPLQAEKPNPSL
jgi:hypothetical protein